ncbi:hypothetical protein MRB53_025408 [Persea americana]|uniref:Uncharacterized protein n=1 Tax=Persea americana TaxID=3435 RepID=A0ACC2LG49_PERAE|nr:hypothetical protein MRB53_025408 [Persea americana]
MSRFGLLENIFFLKLSKHHFSLSSLFLTHFYLQPAELGESAGNGRWEFLFPYLRLQGFKCHLLHQVVCRVNLCSGCQKLLLDAYGATSVCCAVCNTVTNVPLPGTETAQLVCGGCHTLLMYIRGATSVQCSCCHTFNMALEANQIAHVNCGNCCTLLMYQYGAGSVKCAVCNFVTSVGASASTGQKFNY